MERITVEQVENGERFYRLPKALFELDKYKKMSSDSKFLYAILKDRAELSIKNKWIDSEGCVYFIFTINELKEMTGWGKDKIIKLKKELARYELLEEEREGLNKPNRLYLGKIKIELSTGSKPVKSTEVGKSEVLKSIFQNLMILILVILIIMEILCLERRIKFQKKFPRLLEPWIYLHKKNL